MGSSFIINIDHNAIMQCVANQQVKPFVLSTCQAPDGFIRLENIYVPKEFVQASPIAYNVLHNVMEIIVFNIMTQLSSIFLEGNVFVLNGFDSISRFRLMSTPFSKNRIIIIYDNGKLEVVIDE